MPIPSCHGRHRSDVLQSGDGMEAEGMSEGTRGFHGRESGLRTSRLPPGQHLANGFPVLSAGATPDTSLSDWTFALQAEDGTEIASWSCEAFRALGPEAITADIHCVTHWSKFDTDWRGVS